LNTLGTYLHARSKLGSAVTLKYLMLLDKERARSSVMFSSVGGFDVFVHMLMLAILSQAWHVSS